MPEMPPDEVRNALHAIVSRVQADFEAELAKLEEQHEKTLQQTRDEISRDVREKVRSELEASAAADLAAKLDAARLEADRAAEASIERVRREMEEASEAAVASARQEASEAARQAQDELARVQAERSTERQQFATEIESEQVVVRALTNELDQVRAALASAEAARNEEAVIGARASERQDQLAILESLLSAVRVISAAQSLSDTLTALTTAAGTLAPRVALFIVNGRELQGWRADGFGSGGPETLRLPNDRDGLLGTAIATASVVSTSHQPAPAFAALASDRAGLAVPVTVGGQAVAVLYADDGASGESVTPASWPEAMQVLGAHASACLSHITAVRTTQAMHASGGAKARPAGSSEEDSSARRYARLLVSEIKLYNESAVRLGREKRDLLNRLGPEIERARRLYEERVSPSISGRAAFFQEELVHTLADGDRELLGSA
jgi:chemotaxis protein histidine kinase CheA